jgi:type III pantothenate kinase
VDLLAIDVGNTSVTAAGFAVVRHDASSLVPSFAHHRVRCGDLAAELEAWRTIVAALAPARVVVGSVHRFGTELAGALGARLFARADDFPLHCALPSPLTVGVDRLAAALAASADHPGGAICVNAGTAITVDWVDSARSFRGGAIVPGRLLQAKALALHTDQLPEVEVWGGAPRALPGTTTVEAIRHGLDVGVPGMVDRLLVRLSAAAGGDALPVLVSGGDAEWLGARLETPHRRRPWQVARGLALAAEFPRGSAP